MRTYCLDSGSLECAPLFAFLLPLCCRLGMALRMRAVSYRLAHPYPISLVMLQSQLSQHKTAHAGPEEPGWPWLPPPFLPRDPPIISLRFLCSFPVSPDLPDFSFCINILSASSASISASFLTMLSTGASFGSRRRILVCLPPASSCICSRKCTFANLDRLNRP